MQDLNQKKAQLLLREKGVQQKEDKIFQFHKKLKETHQIEMWDIIFLLKIRSNIWFKINKNVKPHTRWQTVATKLKKRGQ